MNTSHSRTGSIVVKFDEETDTALKVVAAKMGKKRVDRKGQQVLVDHTKADAVEYLVRKHLASLEADVANGPSQHPLLETAQ